MEILIIFLLLWVVVEYRYRHVKRQEEERWRAYCEGRELRP